MNPIWIALAGEAALAAEHMAIGVSALRQANYAQDAYYYQAFFALSIGIERAAKLALVLDHAIEHGGVFPSQNRIRSYGRDLKQLLNDVDPISQRYRMDDPEDRLPRSDVHAAIIEILSDFATNVLRY